MYLARPIANHDEEVLLLRERLIELRVAGVDTQYRRRVQLGGSRRDDYIPNPDLPDHGGGDLKNFPPPGKPLGAPIGHTPGFADLYRSSRARMPASSRSLPTSAPPWIASMPRTVFSTPSCLATCSRVDPGPRRKRVSDSLSASSLMWSAISSFIASSSSSAKSLLPVCTSAGSTSVLAVL